MIAHSELSAIAAEAASEAQRMVSAVEGGAPEAHITMQVIQFRQLALLLHRLADAVTAETGGFGAFVDGMRFWIPLAQVEAERKELEALRERFQQQALFSGADQFRFGAPASD